MQPRPRGFQLVESRLGDQRMVDAQAPQLRHLHNRLHRPVRQVRRIEQQLFELRQLQRFQARVGQARVVQVQPPQLRKLIEMRRRRIVQPRPHRLKHPQIRQPFQLRQALVRMPAVAQIKLLERGHLPDVHHRLIAQVVRDDIQLPQRQRAQRPQAGLGDVRVGQAQRPQRGHRRQGRRAAVIKRRVGNLQLLNRQRCRQHPPAQRMVQRQPLQLP